MESNSVDNLIVGEDYSEIKRVAEEFLKDDTYFEKTNKQYPKNESPINLGLYIRNDGKLHSYCYVGVMPLVEKKGNSTNTIIKIKPRL